MPFVTEECWSRLPGAEGLMAEHAPPTAPGPRDEAAEAELAAVQEEVNALRGWRAQRGISPRQRIVAEDPHPLGGARSRDVAPAGDRGRPGVAGPAADAAP